MSALARVRDALSPLRAVDRRWAIATGAVVLAGTGAGVGYAVHSAHVAAEHQAAVDNVLKKLGLGSNGAPVGAVGGASSPSPGVSGNGNGAGPSTSSTPAPSGGTGTKSGGGKATPTPYVVPSPGDAVAAEPNMRTSNCFGYPRNVQCKVTVYGQYYMKDRPSGQIVVEALMDGSLLTKNPPLVVPEGALRFQSTLTFTVPPGPHEIDYEALLEDPSGNAIAHSTPYKTYAS